MGGLRNFQMQTFFVTIPIQMIFFFRGILLQTIVLAHLLVGFATLLLRLTMPDFGRTVFIYVLYVFTWFFCCLLISAFNFRRVGMGGGGGGGAMGANAPPPPIPPAEKVRLERSKDKLTRKKERQR